MEKLLSFLFKFEIIFFIHLCHKVSIIFLIFSETKIKLFQHLQMVVLILFKIYENLYN